MIYEKDWLMRQIQLLVQMLARLLFQKDAISYELPPEAARTSDDTLYAELMRLIAAGNVCEAENRLFERIEPGNLNHMRIALAFYQELNGWSDAALEAAGFPREEIASGVSDAAARGGCFIPAP